MTQNKVILALAALISCVTQAQTGKLIPAEQWRPIESGQRQGNDRPAGGQVMFNQNKFVPLQSDDAAERAQYEIRNNPALQGYSGPPSIGMSIAGRSLFSYDNGKTWETVIDGKKRVFSGEGLDRSHEGIKAELYAANRNSEKSQLVNYWLEENRYHSDLIVWVEEGAYERFKASDPRFIGKTKGQVISELQEKIVVNERRIGELYGPGRALVTDNHSRGVGWINNQ